MNVQTRWKKSIAVILAFCLMLQMMTGLSVLAADKSPVLSVFGLETDATVNPLGIDNTSPDLSWKISSTQRGVIQQSYRIMAATSKEKLEQGTYDLWDTGIVTSDQSVGATYSGETLCSRQRVYWQVTVTDNKGNTSTSEPAFWEMGLLDKSDWQAEWIELGKEGDDLPAPVNYSIDLDFRVISKAAGIVFGAKDANNFLMWQFHVQPDDGSGIAKFRPHQWVNGMPACIDEIDISQTIPESDKYTPHHLTIEVQGNQIITSVDGTEVNRREHDMAEYGKIGIRQGGDEKAAFDNIVVKNTDTGEMLFSEDFSAPKSTFSIGTVTNGELEVINAVGLADDSVDSAPMYRKDFTVSGEVKSARLYATALGIYEFSINGSKVGDNYFAPTWTAYDYNPNYQNYVMYQTYDVTEMLQSGENAIGAITGHGWYSGNQFLSGPNIYGTGSVLYGQLEIEYANGDKQIIPTDTSWQVTGNGPILSDDYHDGEIYDATREIAGWDEPGFTPDKNWTSAAKYVYHSVANPDNYTSIYEGQEGYPYGVIAQVGPTVKQIEERVPVSITQPSPGTYIFDMGENVVGFARLNIRGEAGTTVKLRFAEMLNDASGTGDGPEGTLYTANLRSAKATDYYTMKGDPEGEIYQPRFTYHGFRYVELTGYEGEVTEDTVTGIVLSGVQEQIGSYETSNELINQYQNAIVRSEKGNFLDGPQGCPQRDERMPYTGDGQIFAMTSAMNMDVNQFLRKFMLDITTNQRENGDVAMWAPNFVPIGGIGLGGDFGKSGWGDAVIIFPWTLYQAYGDTQIIRENYDAMKKFIGWYQSLTSGDSLIVSAGLGDWLYLEKDTPQDVISTAYFAYCCDLLSKMAAAIGETEDANTYHQMFLEISEQYQEQFISDNGMVKGDTQTAYLLTLQYGLVSNTEQQAKVAQQLVENIKAHNWHLTTGFLGVEWLLPVLSDNGYSDVAYKLLLQEGYPSWLYTVKNGATSIWERWNSYTLEHGFGEVAMNSYNHVVFGSVGEWFYHYSAGIRNQDGAAGYKEIVIDPQVDDRLEFVNASYDSRYGTIVSNWNLKDNKLSMTVEIPANTTAEIYVPAKDVDSVTESGIAATEAEGLTFVKMEDGKAVFQAGSGRYEFRSTLEVTHTLTLSNESAAAGNMVSINGGEWITLPYQAKCKDGEALSLRFQPVNYVDYKIASISGNYTSETDSISIPMTSDTSLTVKNEEINRENLALGMSVNANSSIDQGSGWNKAFLTDGQKVSNPSSYGYTSLNFASPDVDVWVEIDLGKDVEFNRIQMYPRTDVATADGKAASFPSDFSIQIRKNGSPSYETVGSYSDYSTPVSRNIAEVFQFDSTLTARYVRINVSKMGEPPAGEPYYFQLAELGIYKEQLPVVVDKTALQAAIDEAAEYEGQQDAYTEESWMRFSDALQAANEINEDASAGQDMVDAAAKELCDAIAGLTRKPVEPTDIDRTILEKVLDYAKQAKAGSEYAGVIASVKESFDAAYAQAENIYQDGTATQEQINRAWMILMKEIHKLGFQAGDKAQLELLISEAEALDLSLYVPAGQAEFSNAVANAKGCYYDGDALEGDVEQAVDALLEAMLNLRYKADKGVLKSALAKAAEIDTASYSAQSVAAFEAANTAAKAINDNANATQAEVDGAVDRLNAAIDGLVKVDAVPEKGNTAIAGDATRATGNAKTGDAASTAAVAVMALACAASILSRKKK